MKKEIVQPSFQGFFFSGNTFNRDMSSEVDENEELEMNIIDLIGLEKDQVFIKSEF
jgi:hypothetical protein